jgi:hypothetical protein
MARPWRIVPAVLSVVSATFLKSSIIPYPPGIRGRFMLSMYSSIMALAAMREGSSARVLCSLSMNLPSAAAWESEIMSVSRL